MKIETLKNTEYASPISTNCDLRPQALLTAYTQLSEKVWNSESMKHTLGKLYLYISVDDIFEGMSLKDSTILKELEIIIRVDRDLEKDAWYLQQVMTPFDPSKRAEYHYLYSEGA